MQGLLYSVARVKSVENTLLNYEKIIRILDCSDINDALRIICENGYGQGLAISEGYETIISSELNKALAYIKEIAPAGYGMELFFIEFDYHNAKALVKQKFSKLNHPEGMYATYGNIDFDILKESINTANYDELPIFMSQALKHIDSLTESGLITPRLIDTTLDKAKYNDIFKTLKKTKGDITTLKNYFQAKVDFANLSLFLRIKKHELSISELQNSLLNGGNIQANSFVMMFNMSYENIVKLFNNLPYKKIAEKGVEEFNNLALSQFEVMVDNYLLSLFKSDKHNMFTLSPIAGYMLAKITEAKVLRIIITGIKNKLDKNNIKLRLRELYA